MYCDHVNGDQRHGLASRERSEGGNKSPHSQPLDLSFSKDKTLCTRSKAREKRGHSSSVAVKTGSHKSTRLRMLSTPTFIEETRKKAVDKPTRKTNSELFPCIECRFHGKSARELY